MFVCVSVCIATAAAPVVSEHADIYMNVEERLYIDTSRLSFALALSLSGLTYGVLLT